MGYKELGKAYWKRYAFSSSGIGYFMENISEKYVKTRKEHQCIGCLRIFPKGSELRASVNTDEGRIYTVYICNDCDEHVLKNEEWYRDGFMEGELLNDDDYREFIQNNPINKKE
jgi:hypothetical protein